MMHLITGGERSGKTNYAMQCALAVSENPIYIATARKWDKDFEERIARHQADRSEQWENLEAEKTFDHLHLKNRVVVVDCITLWLTNIYTDNKYEVQKSLEEATAELNKWQMRDCTFFIITNEIGMGVHAATPIGRKFVELQGWTNQHIAACSESLTLMVSGVPLKIK